MTNIRYKNLIKVFNWFINLALYLQIGTLTFLLISFIFTLSGEGELISAYDIELSQQAIDHQISSKDVSLNDLQLIINKGTVQFSSRGFIYYLLKIIDTLFILTVSLLITILLKKIIKSIENHAPFALENTHRIRNIAFLLISIAPYSLIQSLIYRSYIVKNISVEGFEYTGLFGFNPDDLVNKIWVGLNVDLLPLIMGVILIILAEVFRAGTIIKLDNESIL